MKILVTGGAGFIGSHFMINMFRKESNDTIYCLDALTYASNMSRLSKVIDRPDFLFVKGNIEDAYLVEELFEKYKFDYVVNFAAETHVDRSINNPTIFLQTNIIGTSVLLNAAIKYKVKRFHQVSTDEVYGDLPLGKKEKPFSEKSLLNPSSPYSVSKASADMLVLSYVKTYGLDATISRSSNNYGPFQHSEKFIPMIIKNALKNYKIPVYGNGQNSRDWIHVMDHCHAIELILYRGRKGEVYNIGGDNELVNLDLVKIILDKLMVSENLINFVDNRLGHDLRYAVDSRKIINEIGFQYSKKFDEGIDETIEWYKKNEY